MNTPNHPKVKPLTREIALALGLKSKFIDFVFATERPECFRYWCEDISRTSQGLLAYLIDQMQLDGNELEAAAQFCGFRFLPEYREYNDTPLPDGVDWEQARSDFIARIDEKSM